MQAIWYSISKHASSSKWSPKRGLQFSHPLDAYQLQWLTPDIAGYLHCKHTWWSSDSTNPTSHGPLWPTLCWFQVFWFLDMRHCLPLFPHILAISCNWTWYDLTTICEIYISESPLHRSTSFHLPRWSPPRCWCSDCSRDPPKHQGVQPIQRYYWPATFKNAKGWDTKETGSNYWNQVEVAFLFFFGASGHSMIIINMCHKYPWIMLWYSEGYHIIAIHPPSWSPTLALAMQLGKNSKTKAWSCVNHRKAWGPWLCWTQPSKGK